MVQISTVILLYEFFSYILALLNQQVYLSWIVFPHIVIMTVMLFVTCSIYSTQERLMYLILKLLFFIPLLFLPIKISINYYLLGLAIILIYYYLFNINDIYMCDINKYELGISLLTSSVIYFLIKFKK